MKIIKSFAALLCALVLLVGSAVSVAAYEPIGVNITAEAVLLVDLGRNTVVYEKNADARMYPASLTKIMTAVVVMEECADPASLWITTPFEAIDPLYGTDSSVYGLEIDEEITAKDLLSVMMIQSANDAANVLAYHFGRESIEAFIEKMNQKAAALGMSGTHFTNAHGLHDTDHYTTARDLYILTKYAMDIPLFKEIVTSLDYTVPETNMHYEQTVETTVYLQDPDDIDYYYEYVKGVKTGYTDAAGRCLVTTAERDGTSYMCVVLKCPSEEEGSHFKLTKDLYEWAFNFLEYRVVHDTATAVGDLLVEYGDGCETVPMALSAPIEGIVPKPLDPSAIQVDVTTDESYVMAPVAKGQKLGTATIRVNGTVLGTTDVVAAKDVEKSSAKVFKAALSTFFDNLIVKIVLWLLLILIVIFALFIAYCFWRRHQNRKRRRRREESRKRRMEEAKRRLNEEYK